MVAQRLSTLQLELLKVYSFQPSEDDLLAVKKMLSEYFSTKLITKIEKKVNENGISETDLDRWLHE